GARGPAGPQGPAGPAAAAAPAALPEYAGDFVLEIAGEDVRINKVAGCSTPRFAEQPLDCRFTVAGVPPKVVLDWINESLQRSALPRDIGVVAIDFNLNKRQRAALLVAELTRVQLPTLDASTRAVAGLELTVRAEEIKQEAATGRANLGTTASKSLLASNFQATLDGVALNRVAEIRGLVVNITPARFFGGALAPANVVPGVLTLSASPTDTLLRPWVADTVVGKPARELEVTLLDSTLRDVLLKWTVIDTVPLGEASPFAVGAAGTTGRIELDAQGERVTIN
ncbi:MAG: hypothetical protein JHD16_18490, partial [Solirubrobacteraceae bacterium]|nr:hypothetical protein [Solirubrobacteraceae bacterium]